MVRNRFSVWLVSDCAQIFVIVSIVIVTLPRTTYSKFWLRSFKFFNGK